MEPEIVRRLVMGRRMLAGSEANLARESDALAVAKAILLSHDAAELIVSAIAEQISAKRTARMALMEYISAISDKEKAKPFPGKDFLDSLNRERVSFKHHGIPPNPEAFHRVVTRTYDYLDQACIDYLQVPLAGIDESRLIENPAARTLFLRARDLDIQGEYRESLESLGGALEEAVRGTPLQFSINSGDTNPKVALELTAYGVDAGAYIALQEFLPSVELDGTVSWVRREKGHPANWTHRIVSFCLETALDVMLKTQRAPYRPSAVEFTMVFDDVLTAKHDGVLVHLQFHPVLSGYRGQPEFFGQLQKGQRIKGRLTPAFRGDDPAKLWEEVPSIEFADIFVVNHATTDMSKPVPNHHSLVVQAADVVLSDEPNPGMREFFPHLFE